MSQSTPTPTPTSTAAQKALFEGITVRQPEHKPPRFSHRGQTYVWNELTRFQVEQLANDPSFTKFSLVKKP